MSIIQIRHLYKTFGTGESAVHALEDINLDIQEGEIYGIIGLSGAGKSTLVRCMNLLERPTSGTVIVDGKDMTSLSDRELRLARRNVTMIFQSFNLLMQRTVLKNVCFPMEISGVPAAKARKRALELLELVGLSEKADAYPSQLSGGQKQRVAIAGVLAMAPQVIVLDEPTAMLDPGGRAEVMKTIRWLNREKGITILLITHHMDEAAQADRVVVMEDGHIIDDGDPRHIFSQVDKMHATGLGVPQTVEVLEALRQEGADVAIDALTVEECADRLISFLEG